MAKCIRCGKKGLLVRVNSDGLCEECVQRQMAAMREAMTPEQRSYVGLKEQLSRLEQERMQIASGIHFLRLKRHSYLL